MYCVLSFYVVYNVIMKRYIVSNPEILSGTPVIAGTRIPVGQILSLLKEGFTIEIIHEEYPQVPIKVLRSVVDETIDLLDKNAAKIL
jgi:uncharacterized protein (DUF433 family)